MHSRPPRKWQTRAVVEAVGLALSVGLLGCTSPLKPLTPGGAVQQVAVEGCELTPEGVDAAWSLYRKHRPFHAQDVAVSEPDARGCRAIVLSEPPPDANPSTFGDIHPALRHLVARRHLIGVDGHVEDFIGTLPSMPDEELSDLTSRLHVSLFGTAYRARLASIAAPEAWRGSLDVEVRPAELHQWVLGPDASFTPLDGGVRERAEDLFTPSQTGVYVSTTPGIVLWSFPKKGDFADQKANVRIFAVESDLVLGALADDDTVIVIGRERAAPVDVLPPLRFESVQVLAMTPLGQLAQSYERTQLFAGALSAGKDWAPILLSPAIVDTEVGSVLNIADQLLKRWSMAKEIAYERFDYPNEPAAGPFPRSIASELRADVITFNWNTARTGAVTPLSDGRTLYWMHRTGALNVSYLPGEQPDPRTASYEDRARDYFAAQADPYIVRAVQHATLFQAFRQLGVSTEDPIADLEDQIGPDPANDTLIAAGAETLQALGRITDADLHAAASRFAERQLGVIETPTEAQMQKVLARVPPDKRILYEAQLRARIADKWAEVAQQIKSEAASSIVRSAQELRKALARTGDPAAPRHVALACVYGPLAGVAAKEPAGFRDLMDHLRRPEAKKRAVEIGEAGAFMKKHGIDRLDPTALRDVMSALADPKAIEERFRKARNDRVTRGHVRTPSVVHSGSVVAGAQGGHNMGSSVPRATAALRPADLGRVGFGRAGVSVSRDPVPVRTRSDALVSIPARPAPVQAAAGARPPPPPVHDGGWARLPDKSSSGCGEGCIVISPYSRSAQAAAKSGPPRTRFQVEIDGAVGRAGSTHDIIEMLSRSANRQARLGKPKHVKLSFVLRGEDITPDEAMAVADSTRNALSRQRLERDAGFVLARTEGAALLDSHDTTGATVSTPVKEGNTYVVSIVIPRKKGLLMRLFSRSEPTGKLLDPAAFPQGTRTPQDLAAELQKRFDPDLVLELAGEAQPVITEREPGVVRARHAGTTGPTL